MFREKKFVMYLGRCHQEHRPDDLGAVYEKLCGSLRVVGLMECFRGIWVSWKIWIWNFLFVWFVRFGMELDFVLYKIIYKSKL